MFCSGTRRGLSCKFFTGDRAGDLAHVVSQEIRWLGDHSGLVFNHTFGETLIEGK